MSNEENENIAEDITPPDAPVLYEVHSMVRSVHTRTQRAQAAQHGRHKQYVMGDQRRLIRGKPLLITELMLKQHLNEFKVKEIAGTLQIRTRDGRKVDLTTLNPLPGMPLPRAPHPVPDSLSLDTPTGYTLPKYTGETPLSETQVEQVLAGMASVDGELAVDEKTGKVEVVPEGKPELVAAMGTVVEGNVPPPPVFDEEDPDVEYEEK